MVADNPGKDLIPLSLAARIVYLQTRGRRPAAHILERLNAVAYALAHTGPIYAMEGSWRRARRLTSEELALGVFRNGAKELHFLDDRPMLTRITVARESVEKAIKQFAMQAQAAGA